MKILYVTDLFTGVKPLILDGRKNITGSPAFYYPLKKIIEDGNDVDIITPIFEKNQKKNIKSKLLSNSRVTLFYYNNNILLRLFYDIKLIIILRNIILKNDYDFVYGHGSFGTYGTMVANYLGVPCGARVYGSFLYYRLKKKSKIYLFLRYYRQYLPFITKKDFLLMTNDGTQGDKLYEEIGVNGIYDFHFLLNGVSRKNSVLELGNKEYNNIIIYPARIAKWKNQKYAVEIINHLKILGETQVMLYLAGTIYDEDYWNDVLNYVKQNNLDAQVKYIGVVNSDQLISYYKNCLAVLSCYDYSNLGNVTIETLINGGLLIAKNDTSLDGIITNGINGILVDSPLEAAKKIIDIKNKKIDRNKIKINTRKLALSTFYSWEERADIELSLIKETISEKSHNSFK